MRHGGDITQESTSMIMVDKASGTRGKPTTMATREDTSSMLEGIKMNMVNMTTMSSTNKGMNAMTSPCSNQDMKAMSSTNNDMNANICAKECLVIYKP